MRYRQLDDVPAMLCPVVAVRGHAVKRRYAPEGRRMATIAPEADLAPMVKAARERLDAHPVETIAWHFHESTGCPFWLEKMRELKFAPLKEINSYDDLVKFPPFEDEWLRGGPVRRWVPKGIAHKPIYVFETGGTTGIPKSR